MSSIRLNAMVEGEDDLGLRLIANTKKLNKPKLERGGNGMNPNWSQPVIQIFVNTFLKEEVIRQHPNEFAKFLVSRAPIIVASFEKAVTGKDE